MDHAQGVTAELQAVMRLAHARKDLQCLHARRIEAEESYRAAETAAEESRKERQIKRDSLCDQLNLLLAEPSR